MNRLPALLLGLGLVATMTAPAAATDAPRRSRKPPALEVVKLPPAPLPPRDAVPGSGPAPIPNRELEAPAARAAQGPRLDPSLITRPLPSRGVAADGNPSRLEEKLFEPAPGARLRVPFSY
ncbi:hypothetical protein JYK14_25985 [Siccirubricoccus sp. KC 17139]|uniref:Uncharacterized protein n=1 Tax=Siccirubricoccus soli TaxID=2899147 RepID=A0ABT1DCC6_9PROT|nr:hypothetical protein [Siccirubricoccus soli]MCO6419589.1 hypothetical protein [Siccirubricoccus soli]MCP2685724.1 hypothetical protein [Siccirubricoccus soli]